MHRIFYDDISNLEITDLTGQKTQEQIRDEFRLSQLPIFLDIDPATEGYKRQANFIVKTNLATERTAKIVKTRARNASKRSALQTALGLTARQFDDLLEILRSEV